MVILQANKYSIKRLAEELPYGWSTCDEVVKYSDYQALHTQFDIAQKENNRASETFIHNYGLIQENRKLREALQVLVDCTYSEEGWEWSSSMEELQAIAKVALEI